MMESKRAREKIFRELNAVEFSKPLPLLRNLKTGIRKLSLERRRKKFETLMKEAGSSVFSTTTNELDDCLRDIIEKRAVRTVVIPPGTMTHKKITLPTGVEVIKYNKPYDELKDQLYTADASITEAQWGIAETASLVVSSGVGNPRTLSLVPPIHICLLREKNIYGDFSALIKKEGLDGNMPANLVLISGPSRTADIEFKISLGIHGPKELCVILIRI